jgi:hypothetical protein
MALPIRVGSLLTTTTITEGPEEVCVHFLGEKGENYYG